MELPEALAGDEVGRVGPEDVGVAGGLALLVGGEVGASQDGRDSRGGGFRALFHAAAAAAAALLPQHLLVDVPVS